MRSQAAFVSSALAVLRCAAGFLEPVLLALDDASVASQVSALLEAGPEVRVDLQQCACDAELDGVCLAAWSAAAHGDERVVAAGCVGRLEGLEGFYTHEDAAEVLLEVTAVHRDATVARPKEYASDRLFAATGAVVLIHQANSHFF